MRRTVKHVQTNRAMSALLSLFAAVLLFLSPAALFKYLKRRYDQNQIAFLNKTLSVRGQLNSVQLNLVFLRQCLSNGVAPKRIQARIRKAKVYHSLRIEHAFLKDEIERCQQCLDNLKRKFLQHLRDAQKFLSYCDYIRFARLLSDCDVKQRKRATEQNKRNLTWLKKGRYGSFCSSHDTVINLSDVQLTTIQKDVLCRGPHFGIPQRTKSEEVLCEFEMFYRSLTHFEPASETTATQCRSSLEALAHDFASKAPDTKTFSLGREHLKALNELRKNKDLVITRPDKGRASVVMNYSDYVDKMMTILSDATKFQELGPVFSNDKTASSEASLNKFFGELRTSGEITDKLFESIRSTGAIRPRLYGLPKIHKPGVPLRPILSMTGSPQYDVSKWLCLVLEPVRKLYNTHTIKDSFAFIDQLTDTKICSDGHMCSFDVVSLFTNVPLEKTIDVCADALYRNDDVEPMITTLSEDSFRKLLRMVTSGVEFSFNNVMYRQVDGVAMGSPLGPVLADIFVGYCESLVPDHTWPPVYCRFVDDSFAYFNARRDSICFLQTLNDLHPALRFTCEHEVDGQLPFMDVFVEKSSDDNVVTSVYRKPTFTGLYITWDSYCATKYKLNLVRNLVSRAHRICSDSKLDQELVKLKSIFTDNGYPTDILTRLIQRKSCDDCQLQFGPKRCPVYLRLPWKGQWSTTVARNISSVVRRAYYAVNVNIVYTSVRAFNLRKDILPSNQRSNLIYEFECRICDSRYVGRTTQRLDARIRQHVPLHLLPSSARVLRPTRGRPRKSPTPAVATDAPGQSDLPTKRVCPPRACKTKSQTAQALSRASACCNGSENYQSAIARHLVDNRQCALSYDDSWFRVLCVCRSKCSLDILEALFIRSLSPALCTQKNSITSLKLFHASDTISTCD